MARIVSLVVCWCLLAEVSAARAADPLGLKPLAERPLAEVSRESVWQNADNHLRPHKGVQHENGGKLVPKLVWVLCSADGKPLAVSLLGETKVDDYFHSRLEAKLALVTKRHSLTIDQIDKLRLAAKLDLARLMRLTQHVDGELAKTAGDDDERNVNRLFHAVWVACDPELFEAESLFNRVLAKQVAAGHTVTR